MGLDGNRPQLDRVFFVTALLESTRRRLGITGTDTPAYATVSCSDVYSEAEITSAFGPGKEPRKDAVSRGSSFSASPVYLVANPLGAALFS